jgi:hypothetical protein
MLSSRTILIADGSIYAALDLSAAIEDCNGTVAGPVGTLPEALAILDSRDVAGAVIDCEIADATGLILRLAGEGVPLVLQTSMPLHPALERLDGPLSVLMRPVDARTVVINLANEIQKASSNNHKLSPDPNSFRRE